MVSLGFEPRRDWIAGERDIVDHATAEQLDLIGRPPLWRTESRLEDDTTGRPLRYASGRSRPDVINVRIAINEKPARQA